MKGMWVTVHGHVRVLEGPIKVSTTSRKHLGLIWKSVAGFLLGRFKLIQRVELAMGGNG